MTVFIVASAYNTNDGNQMGDIRQMFDIHDVFDSGEKAVDYVNNADQYVKPGWKRTYFIVPKEVV